jgi:hypothetical protein
MPVPHVELTRWWGWFCRGALRAPGGFWFAKKILEGGALACEVPRTSGTEDRATKLLTRPLRVHPLPRREG